MNNFIDKIGQYLIGSMGSRVVKGGPGYVEESADTRYKPRANPSDYSAPKQNTLKEYTGSIRDKLSNYLKTPRTVSYTTPPEQLQAEQEALRKEIERRSVGTQFDNAYSRPAPVQQVQQAPQVMGTSDVSPWSMYGRPESNPYSDLIAEIFGPDSQNFEDILRWGTPDNQGYGINYGGENLDYNPTQVNYNDNGTRDIGLSQINEGTFNDYNNRRPDLMSQYGLQDVTYDQMVDPRLNLLMAKIIYDTQGPGAWYGGPMYRK